MKFVELTQTVTTSLKVFVNLEHIVEMTRIGNYTKLIHSSGNMYTSVRETPEEIFAKPNLSQDIEIVESKEEIQIDLSKYHKDA